MNNTAGGSSCGRRLLTLFLIAAFLAAALAGPSPSPTARAQGPVQFEQEIDPATWYQDHEIEHAWQPDYLELATGDPNLLTDHGVYAWPFALDSIGWSMQSYQDYGGTPYFHHGMDMMKVYGTEVFNRSGGQVINVENYRPGWNLYWEVAILDPDGYIWQYHHIDEPTIPQFIWDKWDEYQVDPVNGGFVLPDTYIGDIIEWPVWSFGKQFNHIHLNILGAGGVFVNGFEFHNALSDTVGPQIQAVGLLQNGQIHPGNDIVGSYSLYIRARDLILDDVYYLPPFEITFSVDGGPEQTTWRFDTLPGGADEYAYLNDFYVVPPTCGDYECRDYYIDLGFIPDSQFEFPCSVGEHGVQATVRDYAGNLASQPYTYTVTNRPPTATPQSVSTNEDTALNIVLTGSDPDCNTTLTYSVVSSPSHGMLSGVVPNLTFTPTAGYYGPDAFTFAVSDGLAVSNPAIVHITVRSVNYAPTADPQSVSTAEDTALDITLTGSDPDDDPLTYSVVSGPNHGTLSGVAPNLTYTPTADYNGPDAFAFVVNDGLAASDPAVVDITVLAVSDAPVADPQSVSTAEDTALGIILTGSDPDGDPLIYSVVSSPSYGMLSGAAPNLTYTPTAGYYGADAFTFVVSDGLTASNPAVVSITVLAVNDAPVLDAIGDKNVDEAKLLTFTVTASDSDLPANALAFSLGAGVPTGASISSGGVFTWTPDETQGPSVYTVTIRVTDNGTPTLDDFETITITVNEVNQAPVLGAIGDKSVDAGSLLSFTVMATDLDVPANTLSFSLDAGAPSGASLDASTGLFTWTPSEAGIYTVTVRVTDDGSLELDDWETIRITINQIGYKLYLPLVDRNQSQQNLSFEKLSRPQKSLAAGALRSVAPGAISAQATRARSVKR